MVLIREFQELDKDGLTILLREQYKATSEKIQKRILKLLEGSNRPALLIAIDGSTHVVGYILIQWLYEFWTDFPEAFISSFYVGLNSRNLGIGSHLLQFALEAAINHQCQRIFLENNRKNPIYNKQFYSKRGWEEKSDLAIFEFDQNN